MNQRRALIALMVVLVLVLLMILGRCYGGV